MAPPEPASSSSRSSSANDQRTKIMVLATLILLTLISNTCSILAITRRKRKISRMYYFLLNLSVADILTAVLTLIPELIWTCLGPDLELFSSGSSLSSSWVGLGDAACRVAKFLQMVAPYLRSVAYTTYSNI